MGCGPRARSALHCPGVLALRGGPVTGAVQDASQLQEDAGKFGAGSAGRHANGRFEASFSAVQKATFGSMGCGPRARSVLHCHGVLALGRGPARGRRQVRSSAGRHANGRFEASV